MEESGVESEYPEAVMVMAVIDNIVVGFFVIEYIVSPNVKEFCLYWYYLISITILKVRFTCAPRKCKFFVEPMNLVDLFAIVPFFLDLIIGGLQVSQDW